jgi:hypothetical protein
MAHGTHTTHTQGCAEVTLVEFVEEVGDLCLLAFANAHTEEIDISQPAGFIN